MKFAGRFEEHEIASRTLVGNPLGDPDRRPLWIYVPPGYDAAPTKRYPSVYMIQGLTGQLDMWRNRAPLRPTFLELLDEYYLDLGAEAFHAALTTAGVTDVRYELFDATHAAIEYRYPLGVGYLAKRLSPRP